MVSVQRVGNMGLLMEGGREARIDESRLRRETLKLSLALSRIETVERMGMTKCADWSEVKRFMVTILLRKKQQAVTI